MVSSENIKMTLEKDFSDVGQTNNKFTNTHF